MALPTSHKRSRFFVGLKNPQVSNNPTPTAQDTTPPPAKQGNRCLRSVMSIGSFLSHKPDLQRLRKRSSAMPVTTHQQKQDASSGRSAYIVKNPDTRQHHNVYSSHPADTINNSDTQQPTGTTNGSHSGHPTIPSTTLNQSAPTSGLDQSSHSDPAKWSQYPNQSVGGRFTGRDSNSILVAADPLNNQLSADDVASRTSSLPIDIQGLSSIHSNNKNAPATSESRILRWLELQEYVQTESQYEDPETPIEVPVTVPPGQRIAAEFMARKSTGWPR